MDTEDPHQSADTVFCKYLKADLEDLCCFDLYWILVVCQIAKAAHSGDNFESEFVNFISSVSTFLSISTTSRIVEKYITGAFTVYGNEAVGFGPGEIVFYFSPLHACIKWINDVSK